MRTANTSSVMTVEPIGAVSYACPPPTVGVSGLLPVTTVAVLDVPQWGAARLRPSLWQRVDLGRSTATAAGYGFSGDLGSTGIPGAERRTAADAAEQVGKRPNGDTARNAGTTENKQQFHLMSRRDPRTWRPPA